MITIVIADDHAIVRAGLRSVIAAMDDVVLVAEAETGEQAVAAVAEHHPDLVIMDLHMPHSMGGLEATRSIRHRTEHTRVVVLTMNEDDAALFAAMQAGASGYLVKGASYDEVKAAITSAAAGEAVFGAAVAARILDTLATTHIADPAEQSGLSDREREVLNHLVQGRGTDEIARMMFLSPKTVRNHVSSLLTKLNVPDRAQAIAWARQTGLGEQ